MSMPTSSSRGELVASVLRHLATVAVFAVVFVLHDLGRALHGIPDSSNRQDAQLIVWILSWVSHALETPGTSVFDANIYFPVPAMLTGSDYFFSLQALFTPFRLLTNDPITSTALVTFLTYPLAAMMMSTLVRRVGCSAAVAWVCGIQFAVGVYRVPFNFHVLQYPNLLLPVVVLAVLTLRDHPTWRRTVVLCVLTLVALLTSLYMAMLATGAIAVWTLTELHPRAPKSLRFLILTILAVVVAGLGTAALLQPYLTRTQDLVMVRMPWDFAGAMSGTLLVAGMAPLRWMIPFALLPGFLARRDSRPWRHIGLPALVICVLVVLLLLVGLPGVLGDVVAHTPVRYFRAWSRLQILIDFGLCLLAAVGLDACRRRLGDRVGLAVVVAFAIVAPLPRLGQLGDFDSVASPALADRRLAYRRLAELTADAAPGSLLELPMSRRHEPDAMLGSTMHWLPLAHGFTAMRPHHSLTIHRLVRQLPRPLALQSLVDLVRLRWILLRPNEDWPSPDVAADLREALSTSPLVARTVSFSGFDLFEIATQPSTDRWIDALAAGQRPGHSALGTPIRMLGADEAVARVGAVGLRSVVTRRWRLPVRLLIDNAGSADWPVVMQGRYDAAPLAPLAVHLEESWTPVGSETPVETRAHRLTRDVEAGGRLEQDVSFVVPPPGQYRLVVRVVQKDGARFDSPRNEILRRTIAVTRRGDPTRTQ